MIGILVLVIVAALALLLIKAANKPTSFSIQRAADFQAPPDTIFARLNNFRGWLLWSPWEGLDPTLKRTYGGPQPFIFRLMTTFFDMDRSVGAFPDRV